MYIATVEVMVISSFIVFVLHKRIMGMIVDSADRVCVRYGI